MVTEGGDGTMVVYKSIVDSVMGGDAIKSQLTSELLFLKKT